ncbi:MAG: DUF1624 domain-containing protein [Lachnospiraceae bacterium]|nr:DUF1624 domain-containing protein [Lachnospiraceae bacterium]
MKRYELIDTLRGLAVINMIGFHACWIMNFFGIAVTNEVLYGRAFMVWERFICIPFIVIAGYCFSLSRRPLKNGLTVFGTGLVITVATCLFLPDIRIVFGVLTCIGSMTLLMIPFDRLLKGFSEGTRTAACVGLIISLMLFLAAYKINDGYLGFSAAKLMLPQTLYRGYASTFIGFKDPSFYSADYFSLIPWLFLYMSGYFLHKVIRGSEFEGKVLIHGIPGINIIGKHSLPIYVIHPIVLFIIFWFFRQ